MGSNAPMTRFRILTSLAVSSAPEGDRMTEPVTSFLAVYSCLVHSDRTCGPTGQSPARSRPQWAGKQCPGLYVAEDPETLIISKPPCQLSCNSSQSRKFWGVSGAKPQGKSLSPTKFLRAALGGRNGRQNLMLARGTARSRPQWADKQGRKTLALPGGAPSGRGSQHGFSLASYRPKGSGQACRQAG